MRNPQDTADSAEAVLCHHKRRDGKYFLPEIAEVFLEEFRDWQECGAAQDLP